MILEAFSQYLHSAAPSLPAGEVLGTWLWEILRQAPKSVVDKVIHCEIGITRTDISSPLHPRAIRLPADAEIALRAQSPKSRAKSGGKIPQPAYFFKGTSSSGSRLLDSLYEYSMSYEQLKWSRFVHSVKASDFRMPGS